MGEFHLHRMRITARTIESRKLLLAPGKEAAFAFFGLPRPRESTKVNKINHRSVAVSRRPRFKAFFEKISLITFSAGARRLWRKLYRMCSLRSSCLTRVEFGPSRSSLFYGFKIYPPSLPGFVSMYRKFVNRLYHYSSVLLCTFARISKYI